VRVSLLLLVALVGCGSKAKTPIAVPPLDAGAEAGKSSLATTPPPTGLPPMAAMPPPGVAGSKKAKRRADAALSSCSASTKPQTKDPAELVKKLGERCSASKMKPVTALLRGQQGDKDASQEQKFRVEANHCYRVYFASDDAAKDLVVVMRDSAGDIVAEAPGPAAPEDGLACFSSADEVSLVVGVGSGKGAWAAQVWGD
jgi:hypothetical protein